MKTGALLCTLLACSTACSDTIDTDADPWGVSEDEPTTQIEPEPQPDREPDRLPDREPDRLPDPEPNHTLVGNWVQGMIGNCIDYEDWLVFAPAGQMEHIVADRNACAMHSLSLGSGEWSASAHELRYEWSSDLAWERRLVTYMLRADGQTLETAAYARDDERFVRIDERESSVGPYYEHNLRIEVSFEEPLSDPSCHMVVRMEAEIDLGANAGPLLADETFRMDCQKDTQPESGRYVIAVHNDQVSDRWAEEFTNRQIWDRLPNVMSGLLYRSFRPQLSLADPEATMAFTPEVYDGAWQRSEDEPPRTMEELEQRP